MGMDERRFRDHLRKSGRSQSVIKRAIRLVKMFEGYLMEHRDGVGLDGASERDLKEFVNSTEEDSGSSAKLHLWAIRHYYDFTGNSRMKKVAGVSREERVSKKRKPMSLGKFVGVDKGIVDKLASVGIGDVEQMLEKGRTRKGRRELAKLCGLQESAVLEFVKLSDIARIPGVKNIRARLYHDAGVDTMEKIAEWDPVKLREMLMDFVDMTGFKGMAPLPKEARCTVETAKRLPKIVEY